jgi:hypothetical protein
MELFTVPRRTWVQLRDEGVVPPGAPALHACAVVFFDHLDGMYSFCRTPQGDVVHLVAWAEVEVVPAPEGPEVSDAA